MSEIFQRFFLGLAWRFLLHRQARSFLAGGFREPQACNGELHPGQRTPSTVEELRELALLVSGFRAVFPLGTGFRDEATPSSQRT